MKDMDMKELDRRIKKGVRNISISPLLVEGKRYNLDTYQEDENGTLVPGRTHCWLTWEAMWLDEEEYRWSREAFSYDTLEEAEEAKRYLEQHLV